MYLITFNAKLYGGEIGLHFHPHPLDWLHYETSFETVTGKKQDGDYLPLIQQQLE
jgi:iron complex outermembrane receptor protein